MPLELSSLGANFKKLDDVKTALKQNGFGSKVIVSERDFDVLRGLASAEYQFKYTPNEELRYIEGFLDIPIGFIDQFAFATTDKDSKCICGRNHSALDIVYTAVKSRTHEVKLIRDAIISLNCLFEIASSGRAASCLDCGREVVFLSYWKQGYMYA